MSNHKVGDRVGAFQSADKTTVKLLGYGVYDGDLPCPHLGGASNPRITLDDGRTVWGRECWWGGEEKIKAYIGDRIVENV